MRFLYFILAIIILSNCGGNTSETTDVLATSSAQSAKRIQAKKDSLRVLYQQYYTQRGESLPLKYVPETGRINPVDEAPSDTALFVFRETLKRIVEEKDFFGLRPHIADDIKVSFGSEGGIMDFMNHWELDTPEKIPNSRLWPTLESVLNLGGAFHEGLDLFEAPYLNPYWPEVDPYTHGVVIGSGVRMRKAPNLTSPVVTTLSYDIVEHLETTEHKTTVGSKEFPWIKVKAKHNKIGYLYGQFYRSPLDYRAIFEQDKNGDWLLITLIAGD